jgi:protein-tyrosine-phosphatase
MTTSLAVPETDPTAAASHVAKLSAELATLARLHGFDALEYILEMARLEAENICQHSPPRR